MMEQLICFFQVQHIQQVGCKVSCIVWVIEAEKHDAYSLEAC